MVSYIICNTKHLHQFPQSLTKTTITFESQYSLLSQVASRFVPSSPTFTLYHVKNNMRVVLKINFCIGFVRDLVHLMQTLEIFIQLEVLEPKKSFAETFFAPFGHFGKVNIFISK